MIALVDVVFEGVKATIAWLTDLYLDGMKTGYEVLAARMFGTPTPETSGPFVFGTPTNGPWPQIHEAVVGGEITFLALLILLISVQGRHLLSVFNLGSAYDRRRTTARSWFGVLAIVLWYWAGVTVLALVDGLTMALLPTFETQLGLVKQFLVPALANPGFSLLFAFLGAVSMLALQALLYLRLVFLYIFLYAMPLGIALAISNLPIVSAIASRFCRQFVPMAILPLPMAILFHGYRLLYVEAGLTPETAVQRYIVACGLPLVALYLSWKTFRYGAPLTARLISGGTKGVAIVGLIGAGAAVAGEGVATTAAIRGPRAASAHAVAHRASMHLANDESAREPPYRRTENDPAE